MLLYLLFYIKKMYISSFRIYMKEIVKRKKKEFLFLFQRMQLLFIVKSVTRYSDTFLIHFMQQIFIYPIRYLN